VSECVRECGDADFNDRCSCVRCRANMAHMRQSRPDSGLGFQVKVLETFELASSSLGSAGGVRVQSISDTGVNVCLSRA